MSGVWKVALVGMINIGLSPSAFGQATLEEIVVTAQKREQSLQDVPISVNAVSGDFLEESAFGRLEDLVVLLPTIKVTALNTGDRLTIRGIGSGTNLGFEQSVGTFIDGVYFGRDQHSRQSFLDIERVEVLRGPQSTYFGNNTIGGAISLTSRKPGDELDGRITAFWGPSDEDYNFEAAIGGPVTETLGIRVAGLYSGEGGFLENRVLDRSEPDRDNRAFRVTGVWTPNDAFDATVKAEIGSYEQVGGIREVLDCPPPAPLAPGLACNTALNNGAIFGFEDELDGNIYTGTIGGVGLGVLGDFTDTTTDLYQLTMNYQFLGHTLTSVTAYTAFDLDRSSDLDNVPNSVVSLYDPTEFDQISQELRITSPAGQRFEYIVGAYWQSTDLLVNEHLVISPLLQEQFDPFDQDEESIAGFGALTWRISEALRATVGARYTKVDKDLTRSLLLLNPATGEDQSELAGVPPISGFPHGPSNYSRSDDDFTPSANIQYDVTDRAMVYVSYAEGFKAGGFDQRSSTGDPEDIAFDPESVEAWEVGAKTSWLDGAMTLNLAAFHSEYSDLQVSIFTGNGIAFFVDNAAKATTQGVELDMRWALTANWSIAMAGAYLDAGYDEFPQGPCNLFDNINGVGDCPISQDFAGKTVPYAPDWSGTFVVDNWLPLPGGLELKSQLLLIYTDDFFTREDLDPRVEQSAYVKLDGRVALGNETGTWEVAVIGKNLTDKDTFALAGGIATSPTSIFWFRERPRYWLLQGTYRW